MGSEKTLELPVIDFTKLNLDPNTNEWILTCEKVQQAFVDYGCFVVKYDEVLRPELHNHMLDAAKSLFDNVSTDYKVQNTFDDPWSFLRSSLSHSHTRESFNIRDATSLEGVTSLKFFVQTVWPHGNDEFCETYLSYVKMLAKLEQIVARMVLKSYGIDKYWENHVESMTYIFLIIKYGATRELSFGLPQHTDKSLLHILDTNHVKGLEVQTKDGDHWIAYKPAPGHVMVMAGDAFFAWSNGRIHSPIHKVAYGGDDEDRYTMKLASYFRDLVEVPKELVDDEHPLLFKPFSNSGYAKFTRDKVIKSMAQDDYKNIKSDHYNDLKTYCGI